MSVYMLTTRKGGKAEAMIAATRKLKATAEKNGAESVTLSQVVAGPDAGQWVIRILCANWQPLAKWRNPRRPTRVPRMPSRNSMLFRKLLAAVW